MNSKTRLALIFITGLAVGFLLRHPFVKETDSSKIPSHNSLTRNKSQGKMKSGPHSFQKAGTSAYFWYPEDLTAFRSPETKQERSELIRLVRSGLENEKSLPRRIRAVTEFCELMTPENAHAMRDAFNESLAAGYDGSWERSIFFARYGEVLGAEAANEFMGDPQFARIAASFALEKPEEAAAWVNELPPGKDRELAVNRVMYGIGLYSPDYAFELFESLTPEDQEARLNRVNLISAARRSGGIDSLHKLTHQALSQSSPQMQTLGRAALRETFSILAPNEDGLREWLSQLPPGQLSLLDRNKLPLDYRIESPATPQLVP